MFVYTISLKTLSIAEIGEIVEKKSILKLGKDAEKAIIKGRKYLEEKVKKSKNPIYGINTGFGSLCNTLIPEKELEKLQNNLVMSHACGTGDFVPPEIIKLMILLKIKGLSYGNSGVHLETVKLLIEFYNRNIIPVVYQQGSLGASGDLAPLAHLSLPLIGMGEVYYKGKINKASNVLKIEKLNAVHLKSKEGLALLNGTQFMSAYGVWSLLNAKHIFNTANKIGALSLDVFDGRIEPFMNHLHTIRPHPGQIEVSKQFRELLKGSEIINQTKSSVQDPYSFRCIPQVHGATFDTILFAERVFEIEINSVTDNPTLFPEEDEIISGGNFHGQALALALDYLTIALSELGNISERRTFQLISGSRNLPPFLIKDAGLNSGFMITQYTAAGIVSQNKQYCTPASADSIVSSNGQEDHVSMGANAATKCARVIENLYTILSIELLNSAQALDLRRPLKSSPSLEKIYNSFRKKVKYVKEDRIMFNDINAGKEFIKFEMK
jgi:histidine ammonia-lyase